MDKIGHYEGFTKSGALGFTSGIIGNDENGVVAGIGAQTSKALENLMTLLQSQGIELASVVKTTVYIVSNDDYEEMNREYKAFFWRCAASSYNRNCGRIAKNSVGWTGASFV